MNMKLPPNTPPSQDRGAEHHPPKCPINHQGIKRFFIMDLSSRLHLPNFCAHFDFFGGSDISKEDNFELPFSISNPRTFGVSGISSSLLAPLVDLLGCCTSFGNVDLLGVKAVATLLADFRMVLRTSHDRFFAKYQSTDEATKHTLECFSKSVPFKDSTYFQKSQ